MYAKYPGAHGGLKRASDSPELSNRQFGGSQCGCWYLNSGPLEEQPAFLTTEPSLWSFMDPCQVSSIFSPDY